MPAGLNRTAELITFSYPNDDSVGGAQPSGTVIYPNLDIRIKAERPTMPLLEQGIETIGLYVAHLFAGNIDIKHNDQIRITSAPSGDWYFGKKFRILSVQRSSNHSAQDRNFVRVILRRMEESHSNDLQ